SRLIYCPASISRFFCHTSPLPLFSFFFFFTDTPPTELYTLSLHDALPIWRRGRPPGARRWCRRRCPLRSLPPAPTPPAGGPSPRSEEHTSELQSRFDLVCRLLLEKKKVKPHILTPTTTSTAHKRITQRTTQ